MYANEKECEAAGLDPEEVEKIARGISRYARQAQRLGLHIFGGSAKGTLRNRESSGGDLICAILDGNYDGGDGAFGEDDDGLLRGEY